MRKIFIAFIFIAISNYSYSQEIIETHEDIPSMSTKRQTLPKDDISIRLGKGAATIIPVFEGDRWDDNSKNAVEYAIELLEEYLDTTYPIKIKFIRRSNSSPSFVKTYTRLINNKDIKYSDFPLEISDQKYPLKVPSASLKRWAVLQFETDQFHTSSSLFEGYDGTIMFSASDIFSCRTDGNVETGKYCMATVTLREIFKILGIISTARKGSIKSTLSLVDNEGMANPYDYVLYGTYLDYLEGNYQYATSEKAKFSYYNDNYRIYSPSEYKQGISMNYFEVEDNNLETILLQPALKKEQSIFKIGNVIRDVLNKIGWMYINHAVGSESPYKGGKKLGALYDPLVANQALNSSLESEYRCILTNNPIDIKLQKNHTTSSESRNIPYIGKKLVDSSYKYQYFGKDGVIAYDIIDGVDLIGWSLYLIKKDGTLDRVATAPRGGEFPFNLAQILNNLPNIDKYARTSDGYLRARVNRNEYTYSPFSISSTVRDINWVQHIYIKWYPEKPTISKKNHYLRVSNDPNSYLKDVEVSMKDVSGITEARVIKREYDGPYSYTSIFNVDPSIGYFTETIDKELTTTFELIVSNGTGINKHSDLLIFEPEMSEYCTEVEFTDSSLDIRFVTPKKQRKSDVYITSALIVNVNSLWQEIRCKTSRDSYQNSVDISTLPKGTYIARIIDNNNKIIIHKFVRK